MRKLAFLPVVALIFAAAFLLAGCAGYQLGPIKPTYLKAVHTIAVPSFKNDTLVPRTEVMLANSVIKQIQQDGTYQIGSTENADAILYGRVENIERQPARSLRGNVLATTEFNLFMRVSYILKDRSGKILAQRTVVGATSFFVGGDVQQDEQQSLPLAAEKAAIEIVNYLSEGW